MIRLLCTLCALCAALVTPAAAAPPDLEALTRSFDSLFRSKTSRGEMSMTVVTPYFERTLHMKVVTRGLEDTLIRITRPRKERGISTLKKGNEMWNYLPKVKKTMRVPPSMMMGAWMGSDMTNDDLVRGSSWEADYTAALVPDLPDDAPCILYTPKPTAPVTWSKVTACFAGEPLLPSRMEYFDEKQRLARVMTFDDVKEMGGRRFPARMVLEPQLKRGHRTVITYLNMEFDVELPPNTFSQAALRQGR